MQIEEIKKTGTSEIVTQEDLDIALYKAIYAGDLKAVDAAIESGANVNSQGFTSKELRVTTNFSPLESVYDETRKHRRMLSKSKRAKLIDIDTCFSLADSLIAAGANTKPLLCRAIGWDDQWTYYLLNKTQDLSGLLHLVTTAHFTENNSVSTIISTLVQKGADINEIKQGYSPLHLAVERNKFYLIKELLKAGASLTQKNEHNLTAFDIALENNNLRLATYLTKQSHYSSQNNSEYLTQRLANLIEIYLYANVLEDEEYEE